jgi:hypothetical protein
MVGVPSPFDQAYVPPGMDADDVTVAFCPTQIEGLVTVSVGVVLTVTKAVSVSVQPFSV